MHGYIGGCGNEHETPRHDSIAIPTYSVKNLPTTTNTPCSGYIENVPRNSLE